jgi:hypothetical protein
MKKTIIAVVLLAASGFAQTFDTEFSDLQLAAQELRDHAEARVTADASTIANLNASTSALNAEVVSLQAQLSALSGRYQTVTILPDLQKLAWGKGTVGAVSIGGTPPCATCYGWTRNPDGSLKLSVTGTPGQYNDWLTGLHFYGQPTADASRILLDLNMSTDAGALTVAQALELDTLVIIDGYRFELSSQLNYNRGGILQVSTGNSDGWHDTSCVPGKLTPDVKHRITWDYTFDRAAKTVTFRSFTLDGVKCSMPPQFAGLPAYPSTWRNQVVIQLQQDTNKIGGSFSSTYDNMTMVIF